MQNFVVTPITNFRQVKETRENNEKRQAVRRAVDDILKGRPTVIIINSRQFTKEDVYRATSQHDCFFSAMKAANDDNLYPLKDLMRRVANYIVCEYLFVGEQEKLGFSK